MKLISTIVLISSFSLSAFAEEHQGMEHKAKDLPACTKITTACEAAGFMPGDHKKSGKGLWVDCVHAIAKGGTVAGVTATKEEAKACQDAAKEIRKEKKAQREAKREERKQGK